ncbi:probable helicase with zinc finger domain [Octopus bimaculoides]|uniref:C3H1-type domain-containing protein n=1 Tax=Octopus bimaculoides TaxID=37653 RepID=A0A0L8HJX9_OCTBM|nr:probable helicase with zinc finger domain [Octopus bimaculoides]|eukprot:XP_014771741.1 PREDICTED: probable helicase with zinc finger domain [Octopus bimaculoides]
MFFSFLETGKCSYSENCTQAHSEDELQEWKDRFEFKKQSLQKARDKQLHGISYMEKLAEKLLLSENPESLLVSNLDYVKLHINSDLKVNMSNKKCTNSWTFTVTSKVCLHRVILLDDNSRLFFRISSISIGPRKAQKHQNIENLCQEWVNYEAYQTKNIPSPSTVENVYRIKVVFKTNIYGTFRQIIVFDFGTDPLLSKEMHVESAPIPEGDKLSKDLMSFDANRWNEFNIDLVKFEPHPLPLSEKEEFLLEEYPLPDPNKLQMREVISQAFCRENYRQWMHDLLYFEELTQFGLISRFNIKVTLQIVNRFMLVPGGYRLAKFSSDGQLFARMKLENELSEDTMHGRLILQSANAVWFSSCYSFENNSQKNDVEKVYEAIIEDKGKDFVFFRLSSKSVCDLQLKADQELTAHVQFQLNRLPKCEMHHAIDNLPDLDIVFPNMLHAPSVPWEIDSSLEGLLDSRVNEKQRQAIAGIIADSNGVRLPPLLLLGPYGTGKTFTLAQAAKLALQKKGTRIMICTHSNSAADLYIKEFFDPYVTSGHPEARPLRIYFRKRWVLTVPSSVIKYSLLQPDSTFRVPTVEDLKNHRVIITTLNQSRIIYDLNLGPDFFTHIFLDEAAQVMETESLIPLGLAGVNTKVVLAGDHMQMSPEIYADYARQRNFHRSLLERLYEDYPIESPCRIMLHENYRSTIELVNFTSSLFYDNKLISAGQESRHPLYWPFTFFTAKGEEVQHQNSTGFFNIAEVYEVAERVTELVKSWPSEWEPFGENSIGVVTPYGDQVQKIRTELRKRDLGGVSVERVVNVQGKQFRVIVLSTVRTRHTCSTEGNLEDIIDYGFLSNVKLLNTAITRAQSLVAVIGDPVSLCLVGKCRKIWEHLLEAATKNGSLIGMSWSQLRGQLDGAEIKKTYVLNPLAPEFVPSRQLRSHLLDDEPFFDPAVINPYGPIKVPTFSTMPFYSRYSYPLYPQLYPPYAPFYPGPYYGLYPMYPGYPNVPGQSLNGRNTPPMPLSSRQQHTPSPLHSQQRPKVKPPAVTQPVPTPAPPPLPADVGTSEGKNLDSSKQLAKTAKLTKGQPVMYMPPNPYQNSFLPLCLPLQQFYPPDDHRMIMVPPRFPSSPYLGSPAFMTPSKYLGVSRPITGRNGTYSHNRCNPTNRTDRNHFCMKDPLLPPSSSPSSTATGQVIQLLPNVKHVPSYLLSRQQIGSSNESSRTNTPISTNITDDFTLHLKPDLTDDHHVEMPTNSRSVTPIEHSWGQIGHNKKSLNGDLHKHILQNEDNSASNQGKSLTLRQIIGVDKIKEREPCSPFYPVREFAEQIVDNDHIIKPSPMRSQQASVRNFEVPNSLDNITLLHQPVIDDHLRKMNTSKLDLPLHKLAESNGTSPIGQHNGLKDFQPLRFSTGFSHQFNDDLETPTTVLNVVKMLDESPEKEVERDLNTLSRQTMQPQSNYSNNMSLDLELQRHVNKIGQPPPPPSVSEMKTNQVCGSYNIHHVQGGESQIPPSLMWPLRTRLYDRSAVIQPSTVEETQKFIEPLTPHTPAGYNTLGDTDLDSLSFLRDLNIGETPELQAESLY